MTLSELKERILPLVLALLAVTAAGMFGYHYVEGWGYLDSLYMTVISISTVGYGEVHTLDRVGKLFTIVFLLIGIGVLTYSISTLTAFIVEGDLRDALRRRRMETKIAKLSHHYILCGAGRTGQAIVRELEKTNRHFVVIDRDAAVVASLQERGVYALHGDATNDDGVLIRAGIERAKGLFGALPEDPDNAFVALSAKGLNPKLRVVCKADHDAAAEKLRRSGADAVISPEFIGGMRMASEMVRPAVVSFLDGMLRAEGPQPPRIEEVKVPDDSPLKGKRLGDIKGAEGDCALILAVKRPHQNIYTLNPPQERIIEAGEILVAMGSIDDLKSLENRVGVHAD